MPREAWKTLCLLGLSLAGISAGSAQILPVPPTVIVDGVPDIPLSVVDAVAPYGRFRQARVVGWHPTERHLVIATTFANVPQLHEVRFPGGARRQLTFFTDGVAPRPAAVVSPKAVALVFEKDTARGAEANQLFRYDHATGRETLITDGRSRNGTPAISRGGLVAYDSTRRNGKDRDLYVVDPANPGSTRLLAEVSGHWEALAWSADDRFVLAREVVSSSVVNLWRVDVADGQRLQLTPKGDRPTRWSTGAWAPDGTLYALGNHAGENARIWRSVDGQWIPVTPQDLVVETFSLSPDGSTLAVVFDLGTTTRLDLLDRSGHTKVRPELPVGVIGDLVWRPSSAEIAFSLAGARTFNDVYSVDARTGRAERWTTSEVGGADPDSLPEAEIIKWKSFDGLEISGNLYRPAQRFAGKRPVIVNVHGGPVAREWPRAIGRSNYFRNELGVALIYPNIRGSSGFGRTFEDLDNGRLRENAIKDIGTLLDWIAKDPRLDASRVMIAGASYGGYVALAAAIEYGDRLRGVNPAFAITDFPSYLESTEISRQANRNAEYGDPRDPEMRAFLTRISPLTNVARLDVPVFIVAGAKDTRIPIAQAEMMVKALKSTSTPVWYVRFENAGHLQLTAAQNDFSIYTWVMFVRKYLLH